MVRMNIRLGFALLALAAASPACAEDTGSDWLGSVGDFVRSGLGPPRTLEDIRREEQQRAYEKTAPVEPKLVQPVPVPVPVPVAAPVPAVEPDVVEPVIAAPAPAPEAAPVPEAVPAPEPKKAQVKVMPPMPVPPMPVPEAKPKPVIVRAPIVPPPPEPLTSRIAATATLDQAVKLGGSAEIYSARIKSPAHN